MKEEYAFIPASVELTDLAQDTLDEEKVRFVKNHSDAVGNIIDTLIRDPKGSFDKALVTNILDRLDSLLSIAYVYRQKLPQSFEFQEVRTKEEERNLLSLITGILDTMEYSLDILVAEVDAPAQKIILDQYQVYFRDLLLQLGSSRELIQLEIDKFLAKNPNVADILADKDPADFEGQAANLGGGQNKLMDLQLEYEFIDTLWNLVKKMDEMVQGIRVFRMENQR